MARTALRVSSDGTLRAVEIDHITEYTRHNTYICNGKCKGSGELCGAEVSAVINGPRHCFRIKPGFRHKPNCPNDESEAAIIRRRLDVTGNTTSMEKLLAAFGTAQRRGNNGGREKGETGSGPKAQRDLEEQTDDRPILREARNPKNLKELCALLSKCEFDDTYAGVCVGDIFIDHRNIESVRRTGIAEGQIAVVLCRKV